MKDLLLSDDFSLGFSCSLGKNIFVLDSLDGFEEISNVFNFTLIVHTVRSEMSCEQLLGTEATVSMTLENKTRFFNGIIGSIKQMQTREDANGILYIFYEIKLYPRLWLLNFTKDCRIFQNMHAIDIVTQILQENGFSEINNLTAFQHRKMIEFCVQYDESCLNFITRLLESQGISYYFIHTDTKHTITFIDQNNTADIAYPQLSMSFSTQEKSPHMNEVLYFNPEYSVVPNSYTSLNYNYLTPVSQHHNQANRPAPNATI